MLRNLASYTMLEEPTPEGFRCLLKGKESGGGGLVRGPTDRVAIRQKKNDHYLWDACGMYRGLQGVR